MARAKKRALVENANNANVAEREVIQDVYRLGVIPVVDFQLTQDINNQQANRTNISIQGAGDILYHGAEWSFNKATGTAPATARLTFFKDFQEQEQSFAVGPLSYQVGDVYSWGDPLVSSGSSGRGFVLFSDSGNAGFTSFDTRLIDGFGQPGWDVELYLNGVLVDFTTIGQDSRYQFTDVKVSYGENIFDVYLYGSQGQREKYPRIVKSFIIKKSHV